MGRDWPAFEVLDTVRLARHLMATPQEVPDRKLATLASFFGTPVRPSHRALDDARATAAVLGRLLAPAGRPRGDHARSTNSTPGSPPATRRRPPGSGAARAGAAPDVAGTAAAARGCGPLRAGWPGSCGRARWRGDESGPPGEPETAARAGDMVSRDIRSR